MAQRRRVKPTAFEERLAEEAKKFEERLAEEAKKFKEAANHQPPGSMARELLLRRARRAETASHINDWLTSPGLQPPKASKDFLADPKK